MISAFDLQGLTHERLVDVVREGAGASRSLQPAEPAVSAYLRNPAVPALRIQTYPRRRSRNFERAIEPVAPQTLTNPTYQDFLVDDATPASGSLETA